MFLVQFNFLFNFFYNKLSFLYLLLYLMPLILFIKFYFLSKILKNIYFFKMLTICLIISLYMANIVVLFEKNQIDVLQSERIKNDVSFPSFMPRPFLIEDLPNFRFDDGKDFVPLSDISNSNIVYCKEDEGWTIYQSDEKGFNNPRGLWNSSNKNFIVLIGDSSVHGACVPPKNNLASIIREQFSFTLSLGRGGNGPLSNLAILKEYGVVINPKIVIWFHTDNDLADLNSERKYNILNDYLTTDISRNLFKKTKEIDSHLSNFFIDRINKKNKENKENIFKKFYYLASLHKLINKLITNKLETMFKYKKVGINDYDYDLQTLDFNEYEQIIIKAKKLTESSGSKFIMVIMPFISHDGYLNPEKIQQSKVYHDQLINIYLKNNINFLDLNKLFSNVENPNQYISKPGYWGHPNSKGYALEGEYINNYLKNIK